MLALGLVTLVSDAAAATDWSGSYYCATKAEGGLAFNKITKTWESARFKATNNFILNMRFLNTKPVKDAPNIVFDTYKITVKSEGSKNELDCLEGSSDEVSLTARGVFSCEQLFYNYKFDMTAARFLQAYFWGYVDGEDDDSDTPFMAGGVCTKIN